VTKVKDKQTEHHRISNHSPFISRVHLFYDMQLKQIRGIPFVVKSHNNTHNKSKCIF